MRAGYSSSSSSSPRSSSSSSSEPRLATHGKRQLCLHPIGQEKRRKCFQVAVLEYATSVSADTRSESFVADAAKQFLAIAKKCGYEPRGCSDRMLLQSVVIEMCAAGDLKSMEEFSATLHVDPWGIGGPPAVVAAASAGHTDVLNWLLCQRSCPPIVQVAADDAATKAARAGHVQVLRLLSHDAGWQPSADGTGALVVRNAARGGHTDVIRLLAEQGVNLRNCGASAFVAAASSGSLAVLDILTVAGLDLGSIGLLGATNSLATASAEGHLSVLSWLRDQGVDPRIAGGGANGALASAAGSGHVLVMEWLADAGAAVRGLAGTGAVEGAARAGSMEALEWLVNRGVQVGGAFLSRAIAAASLGGHLDVLRWLFSQRTMPRLASALPNQSDHLGQDTFVMGSRGGHAEVLAWLFENNNKPLQDPVARQKAINSAAAAGHVSVLEWFLRQGVRLDPADATSAAKAIAGGHLECLEFLSKNCSELPVPGSPEAASAFCLAAREGHLNTLEWITSRLEISLAQYTDTNPAIMAAAARGHLEVLQWFAKKGVEVRGGERPGQQVLGNALEITHPRTSTRTFQFVAMLFEVPLRSFPSAAERSFGWLQAGASSFPAASNLITRTLLINLLAVPSPVAEAVLETATEELDVGICRARMTECIDATVLDYDTTHVSNIRDALRKTIAPYEGARDNAADAGPEEFSIGSFGRYFQQKGSCCWRFRDCLGWNRGHDTAVYVARFAVPGSVSPKVLRALANAPRDEVFATRAARGLVLAAWRKVRPWYYLEVSQEASLLSCICVLTGNLRQAGKKTEDIDEDAPSTGDGNIPAIAWITLCIWLFGLVIQSSQVKARSLVTSASISGSRVWNWVCDLATGLLFVLIFHRAPYSLLSPVLAVTGFSHWWKLLYSMRGIGYFGERLLPILGAFREVLPFTLVLAFYTGAFVHACYALSFKSFDHVVTAVYRLGVLADFAMDLDVYGDADRTTVDLDTGDVTTTAAPRLDWSKMQLLLFLIVSFSLTVAMMNIFIEIMGSAFDRQEEVAGPRFFRARAAICLRYPLSLGGDGSDEGYMWMCYQDKIVEDRGCRSVRQYLSRSCAKLREHLDVRIDSLQSQQRRAAERLNRRLKKISKRVSELSVASAPEACRLHPDQDSPLLNRWQ